MPARRSSPATAARPDRETAQTSRTSRAEQCRDGGRRIARRHAQLPALLTACIASLVAALSVQPLGWASGASFIVSWQATAWLAAFGILTMAVALPCYLAGTAYVPAGQAMLISALEMPLAPLWVWLAFAETPTSASMIGGSVVALAIVWQLRADR